jgi:hypothetical protein
MPTPADQRLLELLDKWLKSLELHIGYSSLDRESYWRIQPWPEHQRPSRWIIDLAVQKAVALKSQVQERIKAGDTRFSDALELMTFLANLIGSEHIERFIPLADPENERDLKQQAARPSEAAAPDPGTGTREMPRFAPGQKPDPQPSSTSASATREMPEFAGKRRAPPPVGTQQVARAERRSGNAKPATRTAPKQPAKIAVADDTARDMVIADAARLVQWGRKWYELAELIARMADRPPLPEVRRILKDNKTAIEKKAGG